jgi:hypothetical protein
MRPAAFSVSINKSAPASSLASYKREVVKDYPAPGSELFFLARQNEFQPISSVPKHAYTKPCRPSADRRLIPSVYSSDLIFRRDRDLPAS